MTTEPARTNVVAGTAKLAGFALLAAVIVAVTWQVTAERISANREAARLAQFQTVLAGVSFDSLDYDAPQILTPPHRLPGKRPARIYRAYYQQQLVAWVFNVQAKGYSGPIELMIGVDRNDRVTAVRVVSHSETPGLGDAIEHQRSDWIESFDGRELTDDTATQWALKSEGGEFDGFTGASITPRAVIDAVRETLAYQSRFRDQLLLPATTGDAP